MNALYLAALSLTLAAPLSGMEGLTDILGGAESGIVYFEEKFTSWMDDINSQIDHAATIIEDGTNFVETAVDAIFKEAESVIFSVNTAIGLTVTVPPRSTDANGGPFLSTISPGGYPYQNVLSSTPVTPLSELTLPTGLPDLGGLLGSSDPLAAVTGLAARDDAVAGLDGLTGLIGEVTGVLGELGGDDSPLAIPTGLSGLEARGVENAAAGLDGLTGILGEVTALLGGLGAVGGDGSPLAAATGLTGGLNGIEARGVEDAAAGLDGLTRILGEVTALLGGLGAVGGDGSPLAAATGLTGGLNGIEARGVEDAAAGLDGLTGILGEVTALLGGLGAVGGDGSPLAAATGLTGGLAVRAANSSSSSTSAASSSSSNAAVHAAIGVSAIAGFVGALLL